MAAPSKVLLKNHLSTSSELLNRALRSARLSSGAPRLFNTSAAALTDSDCSDDEDFGASYGVDPRSGRRSPFVSCLIAPFSSDAFLPMSGRSLMEAMEMKESPAAKGLLTSRAANYSVTDNKADGVHLRFEMPGLGKDDVKVTVERVGPPLQINGKKIKESTQIFNVVRQLKTYSTTSSGIKFH
ncbi:unnamed protein product [Cuscuta campestris]|uniref:SHSP domain-containing protein n=1 Tax=Cuscuta campestris TaxID=132261 RepID=A0A484L9E0_9ASTE|nr:unnamed protein product [Cuscuta campestris]